MESQGTVAVIVVNWNSTADLPACLTAVAMQTYRPLETVVVDNASSDGGLPEVQRRFPGVRWLRNDANRGWCGALNQGAQATAGPFIVSLNPDVQMQPDFIARMVDGMERHGAGTATGKLLRPAAADGDARILDSTGLRLNRTRRPEDRGRGLADRGQWDAAGEVFGACGAAAMHRRAMLDDVAIAGQMWDETLFAYYDDVDLAWRARWRGWRCVYLPDAVAVHDRGGAETLRKRARQPANPQAQARAFANRALVMLKNETARTLLPDLPCILASDALRWAYITARAPRLWLWVGYVRRGWRATLAARRQVQRRRTVPDAALDALVTVMHVGHVLYEPEPGGQATHVAALVAALRDADARVTVISGPVRAAWLAALRAQGAEAGAAALTKWGSVAQIRWLARRLRAARPDIVHLHGQFAGAWGRVAARLAGASHVVYTPHAVQIRSRRLRPAYHLAERWLRRWCDAGVYVCQHDADVAVRRGWATPRQAVVIPNGVDVAALQRQSAGADRLIAEKRGARWVLQVGRLHEQKGPDVLLAAVRDTIVLCPDVVALLAGEGPLRDELQALARRWGIEHRVRFLGWRDDVPRLMAAADVVALASRWEAMPYTLLEAMALGRPCVATHVGGVPEVMQDGVHGHLVPAGDAEALSKALLGLLNDPAQAAAFGRAAAAQVADRFSLEKMQSDTIRLYRRLLGEAWD